MFSAAAKYGLAGAMSLAGISGYTIKETYWTEKPSVCISASEKDNGRIEYRNDCTRTINALICEKYGFSYPLFGTGHGLKACFEKTFFGHEIYPVIAATEGIPDISIRECDSPQKPEFFSGYSCRSNYN